jgi:heat shock protein HslJ
MRHSNSWFFGALLAMGLHFSADQSAFAGENVVDDTRLANATYQGVEEEPVRLQEGRWEGEPYVEGGASRPSVGLAEGFELRGDLDADGIPESLVLLWQSSGGSGTYGYIAVMADRGGVLTNIATAPYGDRVQIRGGKVEDGIVSLEVVQQGEDDAACCPTRLATRSWSLDGDRLLEHEPELAGTLSLSALEGVDWVLVDAGPELHISDDVQLTLSISEGRVAGHSGCNRYSASIEYGPASGEISIGPVMGTRMACPEDQMALEAGFLGLLGNASMFRFIAGQLILRGDKGDQSFTMTLRK